MFPVTTPGGMQPPVGSPPWLLSAWRFIGLRELPGALTQPRIRSWLQSLGAPWTDDETPWCGVLPAVMMQAQGYQIPAKWAAARSWAKWGVPLDEPRAGSVVVYWRDRPDGWTGHVGFEVGRTADGRILTLGGNQKNMITIAPFDRRRLIGRYWPEEAASDFALVPIMTVATSAASSTNEA
jgi:uncharacterized protein (TIGR02594 family)